MAGHYPDGSTDPPNFNTNEKPGELDGLPLPPKAGPTDYEPVVLVVVVDEPAADAPMPPLYRDL